MTNAEQFPEFPTHCKSLLSRFLSRDVFETLKDKNTANGFSLSDVIRSGVVNPDSGIGVYAGDEESYCVFARLFDPIIREYHGFDADDLHASNLNPDELLAPDLDPSGQYIVSTRIRVGRNLAGLPLGPLISRDQRLEVERQVVEVLGKFQNELAGQYYPLTGMSAEKQGSLIADHFLFKAGDRFLDAAGLNRDWPEGRGIFHNHEKTFLVWVNEEDQLRIISMQQGGDIKEVFRRLSVALDQMAGQLNFAFNDHLGFVASCPTNLGTAMRASVHIKLPKLSQDMEALNKIAKTCHLQIRGIHGEHSSSEGSVYDISNRRRLGITEVQAVQGLYDGVKQLIAVEQAT